MQKFRPSESYLNNIDMYRQMHKEGYGKKDGGFIEKDKSFNGISTIPYAPIIKKIIDKNNFTNLLDYGCGKAEFYDNEFTLDNAKYPSFRKYWGIDIDLYDPCYDKYSTLNQDKKYDIVICIDVLEHIPQEDISSVLNLISNVSNKYILLNVACYSAQALLPNGENAHITIKEPKWWYDKIIEIIKIKKNLKIICNCTIVKDGKLKVFPLEFNDKIKNYI